MRKGYRHVENFGGVCMIRMGTIERYVDDNI